MTLSKKDLEACAYLFEFENGNTQQDFRQEIVAASNVHDKEISELEAIIVSGIENELYPEEALRTTAYWALSKRFKSALVPFFNMCLQEEFEERNNDALFQVMIALDNLEVPVFNSNRSGYSSFEVDLNYRDAKEYLNLEA